jgi:transposase
MTNLKYSVGIDVAKGDFKSCMSVIDSQQKVTVKSTGTFKNTLKGFEEFYRWTTKHTKEDIPVIFLMEATGIYYEQLAWFLYDKECKVSVTLPNKAKRYIQGLGLKSKNDKIDANGLSKMCAEQSLPLWNPISKSIYHLRALTRLHEDLSGQRGATINRMEALNHSMHDLKDLKKSVKKIIDTFDKELSKIEQQIKLTISNDPILKSKFERISIIKGVGLITFAVIVSETNGFELFNNVAQLTSYAGYDVTENQSGSKNGKTRISKKGNSHIRRVLHLPAFTAVKYEPPFKTFYERIYGSTHVKMKAYVAIQRKLLGLIYTLWKNDSTYDPKYGLKNHSEAGIADPLWGDSGGIKKSQRPKALAH